MANFRTFTDGDDGYSVRLEQAYELHFLGGNDRLVVTAGTTTAWMGRGNDLARVEGGSAILYGESGDDRFDLHSTATVSGGSGSDLINVRGGSGHWLNAGSGDDRVNFLADTSDVRVNGSYGNDTFVGYSHAISGRIAGADGDDRFLLFGDYGGHSLRLDGGAGNDLYRIDASAPPTIVERMNEGVDTVQIQQGIDYALGANIENLRVAGGTFSATQKALTGNDLANHISGGEGYEALWGLGGNDVLDGGERGDALIGGTGNDRIYGGGGADAIDGGDGNDWIIGGLGLDFMSGGAGADTFVFTRQAEAPAATAMGSDSIEDWHPEDRIDLSAIDANTELAGFQHFTSIEVAMGFPVRDAAAGTIVLAGFGGTLSVLVHTDSDHEADMLIDLWSDGGEAWLTPDNIII